MKTFGSIQGALRAALLQAAFVCARDKTKVVGIVGGEEPKYTMDVVELKAVDKFHAKALAMVTPLPTQIAYFADKVKRQAEKAATTPKTEKKANPPKAAAKKPRAVAKNGSAKNKPAAKKK